MADRTPILVTCDLDLRDVLEGMDAVRRRALDLREFWEAAKPMVKEDLASHFDEGQGPDGPWQGFAKSTLERRRRRRGPLQSRRLRKAWRSEVAEHALVLYPAIYWAGVHDQGGEVGRGAHVPARPFAWISEETQTIVSEALSDYIAEAW